MNKIILLGNMTRNPKTTRKTAEDGREVVITKFDLAVNRRSKRDGEALEDRRNLLRDTFIAAPVY